MGKTVGQLLREIPSSELTEWQAYYTIEPWGEQRADLRAGTIASPLLNVWIPKNKQQSKPSDWIMDFGGHAKRMDPEVMKHMLQGFAAAFRGKVPPGAKKTPQSGPQAAKNAKPPIPRRRRGIDRDSGSRPASAGGSLQ